MDNSKTYQKILDYIKNQTSPGNFRTWFSQTSLQSLDEEKLVIATASAFIKDQLKSRYENLIHEAIEKVLQKRLVIEFTIDSSLSQIKKTEVAEEEDIFQFTPQFTPTQHVNLNSKYTLENFVVGLTNNLAYAAAQAVVQSPGISYNPLFIYGPSGVGKTHLMQGIGNALFRRNPTIKIIYASSERFMNDFVDSIQNKKSYDFRQKYRNCDLLLIDDIQFISGKDSTQEEFFHTFNELQSKNSQIVLTSDRPPQEMQKLEARLMSRFQGGLMVDIQLPDFDTRVAVLRSKLLEKGDHMSEECINLIAENVSSNTRELEGKLIQILQMAKLSNQPLTIEVVQKFLGKQPTIGPTQNLDHKKLLNGINQFFNLKMADLTGPRRQKELVLPRQIAMFLMYEECKLPMERIGQILGGRDHTTVLHGIEKIRTAISQNQELQKLVGDIKHQLIN